MSVSPLANPAVDLPVSPALTEAPILAQVVRSGTVESVHRGTVVVTGPDGSIQWSLGDPAGPVYPRSACKPLQAVAMVRLGLDVPDEQLSVACASHSGEPFHLAAVQAMLASAGLGVEDLQNTPDYPIDPGEHDAWIRAGRPKASLAQNCSGKHAAMLATCRLRQASPSSQGAHGSRASRGADAWDPASYRDPEHPLQQCITEVVEELTGEQVTAIAVDGCGAPAHQLPIVGLARAFGRLAVAGQGTVEARVRDAIRARPEYLGGTHRQVTTLIREVAGLVAKDGAESVYAVGLADGRGVAVKVADGNPRAKPVVLGAVLQRLGVTPPTAVTDLLTAPVLGHGEPVGAIVPAPALLG